MRKLQTIILGVTLVAALARPVQACTDVEWLNYVYLDLFFTPAPADVLDFYAPNGTLIGTRGDIALAMLSGKSWPLQLVGGGDPPSVQGYYQRLLGRNPSNAEAGAALADFANGATDEAVIGAVINGTYNGSPPGLEYLVRVEALNPALAQCDQTKAIIDQLCLDLLGRQADDADYNHLSPLFVQGNATAIEQTAFALEAGLSANSKGASYDVEYHTLYVKNAALRHLHRLPTAQELTFYLNRITGGVNAPAIDEAADADMLSKDEVCDPNAFNQISVTLPTTPASIAPSLQNIVIGPIDQQNLAVPQYSVYQLSAASLERGLEVSVASQDITIYQQAQTIVQQAQTIIEQAQSLAQGNQNISQLNQTITQQSLEITQQNQTIAQQSQTIAQQGLELNGQQSTITALVDADFGMSVDPLVAEAARVVTEAQILAAAAATGPAAQRALQHARAKEALGDVVFAQGDPDQALNDYRDAFRDATRAVTLASH